eukprot:scaffold4184_cov120-Isochrysis_galbana.AAC.3
MGSQSQSEGVDSWRARPGCNRGAASDQNQVRVHKGAGSHSSQRVPCFGLSCAVAPRLLDDGRSRPSLSSHLVP